MTDNKIIELTPFRADLTRSLSLRGERLLASADLAEEVATLEPLEAYYIVKEMGLNQALPIILHMSHEQLQASVDLDCWSRHDFAADNLNEWLAAFAQAGPEALASSFLSLDYVVQLLFLAQTVTVYDPDTDQVPAENRKNTKKRAMTPDGFYLLELKTTLEMKIHPFTLLDSLYQYDPTATHQLLSEVRVELPSQIEEEALRFRGIRMQEIGFATPDEAAILFSAPSKQPSPRHQKPEDTSLVRVPSVYAAPLIESSLLQQALSLIGDKEFLSTLEQEIIWAINSAIISYGENTNDMQQITDITERVRDTVSLGLESLIVKQESHVNLDDPATAAKATDLLHVWTITDLFRHGFAATQALKQEARKALEDPQLNAWYELSVSDQSDELEDRLDRAFVAGLLERHPLRSGIDLTNAEAVKAFSCLADIDVARLRLKRLVARISSHD